MMKPSAAMIVGKLACAFVFAASLSACATDSTLTIENDSSYTFIEINVAPIDQRSWGPDLLHGEDLFPGESVVIQATECDTYDVRVVDETNLECILEDVDLCLDDSVWRIDDLDLALCAFSAAQ